ncbi:MAG: CIA30 family protein, partial [Elusimicrobiota bacterium]|nr:CIA30 family protein [Elusimicrobiota bacterium]
MSISEGANLIDYKFGSGKWIGIYKHTFADLDISSGDAIRFYFKGSGGKNHLKLQIYDSDGDVFDRKIEKVTDISQWTEMIIPFSSLCHWEGTGNGLLDTKKISKIAFAVTPSSGDSGNIAIDEIESYNLNTGNFFLVSSFNFGTPPNEAGGNEGPMSPEGKYDPVVSYDRTNAYEGIYALTLNYDFPAGKWCGYWIFLSSAGESGFRDLSSYTDLKFWVKSDAAGKTMKIELIDSVGIKSVQLTSYLPQGTATSYQEVSIPLSHFTGLVSTQVKQINFVFDQFPSSGTVYIDYIRFTSAGTYTGGTVTSIDDMNMPYKISGWANYGRDEDKDITSTELKNVAGYNDNAIELQYKFKRSEVNIDDWVVIERDWGLNLADYNAIKFQYKGTGGNNNLEFKLGDKNGTVFLRKFFSITDTGGEWKEIVIPFNELSLFKTGKDWQGNVLNTLNLNRIKSAYFTLSKNAGGSGTFSVKDLEITKNDFETSRKNKIIKSLKVINNPFSPNNDGIKDKTIFVFTLSEIAKVKLVIYDLSGDIIYKDDKGSLQADTEYTIEWIGNKTETDDVVPNGLYF